MVGVLGGMAFGLMGSFGLLLVVAILEQLFVPPLRELGGYGQFGFVMLYTGTFGVAFGCSLGLCVFWRFWEWLFSVIFLIVPFILLETDLLWNEPQSLVAFGHYIVFFVLLCTAVILRLHFGVQEELNGKTAEEKTDK